MKQWGRSEIKDKFGRQLVAARKARGLSRVMLGLRLGISPKTIQSWEMGRSFVENLNLLPILERELGIDLKDTFNKKALPKNPKFPQPLALTFNLIARSGPKPAVDRLAKDLIAIPLLRQAAATKDVHEIARQDIVGHAIIPRKWIVRGRLLTAFEVKVPGGKAIIIVNRAKMTFGKKTGRKLAIWQPGKGLRVQTLDAGKKWKPARKLVVVGRLVGMFSSID